jgi:hypothetical protein
VAPLVQATSKLARKEPARCSPARTTWKPLPSTRGRPISAIAHHPGRDRTTIRAYLTGMREPGKRKRTTPDPFAPFVAYATARLIEFVLGTITRHSFKEPDGTPAKRQRDPRGRRHVDRHIIPTIGTITLDKLTPWWVQQ